MAAPLILRHLAVRAPIRRRPYLGRWIPFAVLAVAGSLTATAAVNVAGGEYMNAQSVFESDALEGRRAIQVRVDTVIAVTRAAAALMAARPEINYSEFRAFVAGLELEKRYPGVEGIGFAPRVDERRRKSFERNVALDGASGFTVRPGGFRKEYFPAVLFEPAASGAASVIGLDLGAEPAHLQAMERARDSGMASVTEVLGSDVFTGGGATHVVVLYLPVYRPRLAVTTVTERRRALVGFVFGRLRPDVLLRDSVLLLSRSLVVDVFDAAAGMSPLYASAAHEPSPRFQSMVPIRIGGREWRLSASSRAPSEGLLPPEAQRVLATGMLLSLLLFALMRAQARARETSERHAAELQATDRAKDEFLAVLSHELRTPLNVLLGWLAMLRSGAVREERRGHALDVIERNAREQAQLIEDLLDVSRILMGKIRLDKHALDLVPAVGAAIDALRPSAETRGVSLQGPEPPADLGLFIAADAARFQQIITNLLWNALKFTPLGGSVWVNVAVVDDAARISVCDTGVGIAPELLPHVFDRFWQADSSTTRTYNGMGMGLAIVRDLVHLHGGRVDAHSGGRNEGSTFTVTLPLIAREPGTDPSSLILAAASPH